MSYPSFSENPRFLLSLVLMLSCAMVLFYYGAKKRDKRQSNWMGGALMLVVAFIVAVLGMDVQPLDGGEVFLESLRYSGPITGIFLLLFVASLKGKSLPANYVLAGIIAPFFLFSFGGMAIEVLLNSKLDTAPSTAHAVPVLKKRDLNGGRRRPNYQVVVQSWRPGHGSEGLLVHEMLYRKVQPGTIVTVVTKPGYFGHEWIVDLSLADMDGGKPGSVPHSTKRPAGPILPPLFLQDAARVMQCHEMLSGVVLKQAEQKNEAASQSMAQDLSRCSQDMDTFAQKLINADPNYASTAADLRSWSESAAQWSAYIKEHLKAKNANTGKPNPGENER